MLYYYYVIYSWDANNAVIFEENESLCCCYLMMKVIRNCWEFTNEILLSTISKFIKSFAYISLSVSDIQTYYMLLILLLIRMFSIGLENSEKMCLF